MEIYKIEDLSEIKNFKGNILLLAPPSRGKIQELLEVYRDPLPIVDLETRKKIPKLEKREIEKDKTPIVIVDISKVILEEGLENLKNKVKNSKRVIAVTTPYRGESLIKAKVLEELNIEKIVLYRIDEKIFNYSLYWTYNLSERVDKKAVDIKRISRLLILSSTFLTMLGLFLMLKSNMKKERILQVFRKLSKLALESDITREREIAMIVIENSGHIIFLKRLEKRRYKIRIFIEKFIQSYLWR